MKRILVPCDFSEPSKQAFKFAVSIAAVTGGEVYVLHVVEVPVLHNSMLVPVKTYESSFLKELKLKYNKNVQKMKEQWAGKVRVHSQVEHGSVESGIKKLTDKKKIDLIVMGTHGVKGISAFVLGSNTQKVIRDSKVPVIVVKKSPQLSAIKDILFPTDFSKIDKKYISLISDLQKLLKARLQILFINKPENFVTNIEAEQALMEFVADNELRNYTVNIFNDITEEKGIIHFSQRFKNKMIAMPTHARKGLNHFFNGSVTEDVIENMNWPILTFHQ